MLTSSSSSSTEPAAPTVLILSGPAATGNLASLAADPMTDCMPPGIVKSEGANMPEGEAEMDKGGGRLDPDLAPKSDLARALGETNPRMRGFRSASTNVPAWAAMQRHRATNNGDDRILPDSDPFGSASAPIY